MHEKKRVLSLTSKMISGENLLVFAVSTMGYKSVQTRTDFFGTCGSYYNTTRNRSILISAQYQYRLVKEFR